MKTETKYLFGNCDYISLHEAIRTLEVAGFEPTDLVNNDFMVERSTSHAFYGGIYDVYGYYNGRGRKAKI